ncbi:hypothetical protein [Pseudemcibacter aquimaris]|uniref:hypothetical protein n=1 Tax=Pseudemcibacter aquimaris TaxID=2857064 RepID=UPI0020125DE7|nr:hypothetical protein [Pseudemcibacter aquimaris]MCC3860768.1 hypothetical protein [Pseudemcibacter aquimaris]WDU59586.1 hypothetical protein KW060_04845 [Pseudemcibacter aquimaris]
MLKASQLTITNIRKELDVISAEMLTLIKKYNLMANSQLEVIEMARTNITDQNDYIRFLELSLEGRIYGEAAAALEKATVTEDQNNKPH